MKISRRSTIILGSIGLVLVALLVLAFRSPRAALADFDPAVLAASEARMWEAYYDERKERVAFELIGVLREQFGLSYAVSVSTARDFAEAAARFRQTQDGYEEKVLPPLQRGYDRIRRATRADWAAREVAKAELAWWVARRTPGQWSTEYVGNAIGRLYEVLYGIDAEAAARAGQLRAQAANLRFMGAYTRGVDWDRVRELLTKSYGELRQGIEHRRQGETVS